MAKTRSGVPLLKAADAIRKAIAAAQESRGLNNSEAAAVAGVARPNYVAYVHGGRHASIEKLAEIAESFGVKVYVSIHPPGSK